MEPEVRYQMLRPAQVVERRKACPVAYVPIGNLEWHGVHNPLGADTLQAEGIAIACARKGGGLAFPPLYYGENRLEALVEADSPDRLLIADEMGLPPESFAPAAQPFSAMEQTLHYQRLLLHILAEVESLGFRLGVLVAGHYPLIDHARAAALLFNKRRAVPMERRMLAWAFCDFLLLRRKYDSPGDHGGGWETSHCMALHPQTVDLSLLPPKGEKIVGAGGHFDPRDANAEFGRKTIDDAVEMVLGEVRRRLANRDWFWGHGRSLDEAAP